MKAKFLKAGIVLLGIAVLSIVVGGWIRTQAQSQDDAAIAKRFVGTWRLVSWPQRMTDGTTKQNPKSVGYLIYTDDGHMCFVTMNPNRPKWKSGTPTADEMATSLGGDGFNAYCSAVEIHAKEGFVLHKVELDGNPSNVGTVRKRWFTFDGPNRLSLRIDQNGPGVTESTLIWERVQK
jgi:hypothetical protein